MTKSQVIYQYRLLGVVTLYNPDCTEAAENIKRYITDLDMLIVWDNSPLENNLKADVLNLLGDEAEKVVWHGDGQNTCIAPAINFAMKYAKEKSFDLLLIMDQDSRWKKFSDYRKEVEALYQKQTTVFAPYVEGCDTFEITNPEQKRLLFINSGTIIPTKILEVIGEIDEKAFPLDAIDYDMALSVREKGYEVVCLTNHRLIHTLGQPQRMGLFKIRTNNYNSERLYGIVRSHVICYRKHRAQAVKEYRRTFFKKFYFYIPMRILLAEPEKLSRLKAHIKGLISGYKYPL